VLGPSDKIISKTDHDDITASLLLAPSPASKVKHIVQVIVPQRTNASPLNRTDLTLDSLTILKHTGRGPFRDQPHDALIRAMLDELHEPRMLRRIEEAAQIRIELSSLSSSRSRLSTHPTLDADYAWDGNRTRSRESSLCKSVSPSDERLPKIARSTSRMEVCEEQPHR